MNNSSSPHLGDHDSATHHQKAGRRICREHRQQKNMENLHNPQVQTEKEAQPRTKQAQQGPGSCKRQHATAARANVVPLPTSYSPTIMPLTFALFLQLHMATMDIKSAYLNAPLPPEADWIVTTLEPRIASVCGLDPAQDYRIANALYGVPPALSALQDSSPRRRLHNVRVR